jgi:hypothetical protein
MKKLAAILAGVFGSHTLFAVTNLILIGNGNTQSSRCFHGQLVPWQANLIPLVILIAGVVHLFCPRMCWYFKWGWRFGGSVEPSAIWLFFERLGGVFITVIAVYIFLMINGLLILPHQ